MRPAPQTPGNAQRRAATFAGRRGSLRRPWRRPAPGRGARRPVDLELLDVRALGFQRRDHLPGVVSRSDLAGMASTFALIPATCAPQILDRRCSERFEGSGLRYGMIGG